MNSSPSYVILIAAAVGLVVNTIAVLGVSWRGGRLLGHIDGTLERFAGELDGLRDVPQVLARAVTQLENLEHRVRRLEDQRDEGR